MRPEVIRAWNTVFTGLLIVIPLLYVVGQHDTMLAVAWGPAFIFAMFLVLRVLHFHLESSLSTSRLQRDMRAQFKQSSKLFK